MKMRSWSTRDGIMLVPSTFTGWYKNMITAMAISTLNERSRSQARVARVVDSDVSSVGGISGSILTTIDGRKPWRLLLGQLVVEPAVELGVNIQPRSSVFTCDA